MLKLGVIGAGVMGRNYLRAAKTAGIPIAFITDTTADAAKAAGAEFGCAVNLDPRASDMQAAVIAVPTAAHAAIAAPLLKAGIHCLVEKPFVASEAEGRNVIAAAGAHAVLQVGHIERFNPAVEALTAQAIDATTITSLTARRMGPASARVTDISVVSDLMVHDLDIVLALKPLPVINIEATGNIDHAEAKLTFSDGAHAILTASRTSPIRIRTLDVAAGQQNYHLDYIAKSLLTGAAADHTAQAYTGDALAAELAHFIACIEGRTKPRVGGEAALAVMTLAWQIEAALGKAA
jgi:predicted dehydrogenase